MIVFDRVSKSFDSLAVLNDLDLTIGEHQIVGIVGPSGVGKTTILKLLSGVIEPDSGEIRGVTGDVGYVFQEPRLLPWGTALDNVAVVIRARGAVKDKARGEAGWWLEQVGLKGFEGYYPRQLSGGMAQRVCLARAFAADPDVLLMDEPFSNMDAKLKSSLLEMLEQMTRERGITVVYVTHDLGEVIRLADRIVELLPDRTARELDLSDRRALMLVWLSSQMGPGGA